MLFHLLCFSCHIHTDVCVAKSTADSKHWLHLFFAKFMDIVKAIQALSADARPSLDNLAASWAVSVVVANARSVGGLLGANCGPDIYNNKSLAKLLCLCIGSIFYFSGIRNALRVGIKLEKRCLWV